jgi:hypothetical protein
LTLLVWLVLGPSLALAQSLPSMTDVPTGPRPNSWHVWNGFALGVNQLVLGDQLKIFRKMPWGEGKHLLTTDSHWRAGLNSVFSPAYIRPAAMIGISPLLICDLELHYGPGFAVWYYKYKSLKDKYDPQNLGDAAEYFHMYHDVQANMTWRLAYGPVAVLSLTDLDYFSNNEPFFHWELATIVKEGFFVRNKSFLLFEFEKDWRVFFNYEIYRNFNSDFLAELLSSGFVVMYPPFHNLLVIIQLGYHLRNPDFGGLKFWAAATMEWDFPDKK